MEYCGICDRTAKKGPTQCNSCNTRYASVGSDARGMYICEAAAAACMNFDSWYQTPAYGIPNPQYNRLCAVHFCESQGFILLGGLRIV